MPRSADQGFIYWGDAWCKLHMCISRCVRSARVFSGLGVLFVCFLFISFLPHWAHSQVYPALVYCTQLDYDPYAMADSTNPRCSMHVSRSWEARNGNGLEINALLYLHECMPEWNTRCKYYLGRCVIYGFVFSFTFTFLCFSPLTLFYAPPKEILDIQIL